MTRDEIAARIQSAIPDASLELSGADCSFSLDVISARMQGLAAVARQRLVLGLFAPELASGALHALSVRARTPEEARAERA